MYCTELVFVVCVLYFALVFVLRPLAKVSPALYYQSFEFPFAVVKGLRSRYCTCQLRASEVRLFKTRGIVPFVRTYSGWSNGSATPVNELE
jgi:hypothetical protein